MSLTISKLSYGNLVVGVDTQVQLRNGKKEQGINFDNAATTPPLVSVIEEIRSFAPYYSSIHRGAGYKAKISSAKYEEARKTVMNFVGADTKKDVVIFVKNATEAINKVAYRFSQDTDSYINSEAKQGKEKYVILSTSMEHHSNDLPWRGKYEVDYIEVDECGRLVFDDLVEKLEKYKGRVKLVTVAGASNVTGYVNPVHRIAEWAHKYGAKILVDGSQLIPHMPFDMKPAASSKHIDFLVFSAHKMYAPFGIGVLIGPWDFFEKGSPDYAGGGTVKAVTHDLVVWNDPPSKDEAGTPNLMGVVALAAAIKTLSSIGMRNIDKHEKALTRQLIQGLRNVDCIEMYCTDEEGQERVGIVPFNMKAVPHEKLAEILAGEAGIAVRSGCFCAHPYVQRLMKVPPDKVHHVMENPKEPKPGMVRVSFGLYNEHKEVEQLLEVLQEIAKDRRRYLKMYS
ncbi:MAG: aminotransferase class V-fold PLP-dependent enzyme [Peptococcaceae bacterium]|nr:aminotransferase class V-fold PLP-dependent enzyme [Peptococcaceae bacterium]